MDARELENELSELCKERGFDLLIDGLLGMQMRPGLRSPFKEWIELLNNSNKIAVRISIDLPSGICSDIKDGINPFRADFTYCTGIVKAPIIEKSNQPWVGRLRYLDLNFFDNNTVKTPKSNENILRSSALPLLRKLRPVNCDKRNFGHLLIIAGSRPKWEGQL